MICYLGMLALAASYIYSAFPRLVSESWNMKNGVIYNRTYTCFTFEKEGKIVDTYF